MAMLLAKLCKWSSWPFSFGQCIHSLSLVYFTQTQTRRQINHDNKKLFSNFLQAILITCGLRYSGVNFINIFCALFSYECRFWQLISTYVRKKSCQNDICTKNLCVKTLMKLTPGLFWVLFLLSWIKVKCIGKATFSIANYKLNKFENENNFKLC